MPRLIPPYPLHYNGCKIGPAGCDVLEQDLEDLLADGWISTLAKEEKKALKKAPKKGDDK